MNGVLHRLLFPRKQTLKLLKLDLQNPCCFQHHHELFLLSVVEEWCLSYQKLSQGLPSQVPTPDTHQAGHWADRNWQTVPSPKEFTISIKKKKKSRQRMVQKMQAHMLEDISGWGWKRASVI